MTIYFIITHDHIQQHVKMETSMVAAHKPEVGDVVDVLIMDEDHDPMFRQLFEQAHAEVISKMPVNYLMDTPTDIALDNFRADRDFVLFLNMPDTFPLQYKKSVGIMMNQFFTDYVCYRWLETKSPQDAQTYAQRSQTMMQKIQLLLARRTVAPRLRPSFP